MDGIMTPRAHADAIAAAMQAALAADPGSPALDNLCQTLCAGLVAFGPAFGFASGDINVIAGRTLVTEG